MNHHEVVSEAEWLEARKRLLAREKAYTKERDALSAARRALPYRRLEQTYVLDGPQGKTELSALFAGKSQLIVYHFMFAPEWQQGCKSCSFVADHFDGTLAHLAARDTAFAAVSRAPYPQLEAFRCRMGWKFPWYSSADSTFNQDFRVSFSEQAIASGSADYNYGTVSFRVSDAPGFSVFLRDGARVLHSYSSYGRGVEQAMITYSLLDLTPRGRDEDPKAPMSWVRHHDRYTSAG
ncbi:MAG: protein of unknown function thioredoxin family protein [Myxococcaceae bacterium]|nr:protein of unknown function thioredoxin family protein [Myxococcaceae bacterium]